MNLFTPNKPANLSKKLFLHAAAALAAAAALFLAHCYSNPSTIGGSGTETPNRFTTVNAKWEIADLNVPFASIELIDDGTYIVMEREENPLSKPRSNTVDGASFSGETVPLLKANRLAAELSRIRTGRYEILDSIIHLKGFGKLEIGLDSAFLNRPLSTGRLQLEGESYIHEFIAERVVERIVSSPKTDLICRHWRLVGTSHDVPPEGVWRISEMTILFSKTGTLLTTITYLDTSGYLDHTYSRTETLLTQWRWVDDDDETNLSFYNLGAARTLVGVDILTETRLRTQENNEVSIIISDYRPVDDDYWTDW